MEFLATFCEDGVKFSTLAHRFDGEKYKQTSQIIRHVWKVKNIPIVCIAAICTQKNNANTLKRTLCSQEKWQKSAWKQWCGVFISRPRTFLCVRLHSCGGVAIQGFDWILLSGLAKALGCHLQHADSTVTINPVVRLSFPPLIQGLSFWLCLTWFDSAEPDRRLAEAVGAIWGLCCGWGGLNDTQKTHMARCDFSKHLESKTFMQESESLKQKMRECVLQTTVRTTCQHSTPLISGLWGTR